MTTKPDPSTFKFRFVEVSARTAHGPISTTQVTEQCTIRAVCYLGQLPQEYILPEQLQTVPLCAHPSIVRESRDFAPSTHMYVNELMYRLGGVQNRVVQLQVSLLLQAGVS